MTKQRETLGQRAWITVIVALTATLFTAGSVSAADPAAKALVTRARFLVLDSRIIERTENAKLTLGKTVKSKHNPLMAEDKPWEVRFDNLYANVIYDEQEKIYKCWYNLFVVNKMVTSTPEAERNPSHHDYMAGLIASYTPKSLEMAVCYAVSQDGITWEKPELGLVEFAGSKQNNILIRGPHGPGVFKDLHESDPARRYKMFTNRGERTNTMVVMFSPDGIHWGMPIFCPQMEVHWPAGDTHNNAFWAPELGKYVGFTRLKYGRPWVRQVARTESSDFVNWTKAEVVLEGVQRRLQTHDMVVFPTGGVYIGLLGMMDFPEVKSHAPGTKQHVELAWSPDSKQWHRIQPGTPFIGHTPAKKKVYGEMPYDWGTIFAAAPIFGEDEIQIYYSASDWYFFEWRKGYLARATLRPDGWAGYEQITGDKPALIKTTPVNCVGDTLQLCADVRKDGFVEVRLLDKDDQQLAESDSIKRTVTDAPVRWQEGFSIKHVKGKQVRLEFELNNAKLYSFGFDLTSQAKINLALSNSIVDRKEDVERLVAALIERKQKREAARIRRLLPPEQQVPGLIAELRDADPRVRELAADQLARIALQVNEQTALLPAVAPLVAALSDQDMQVRDESTEALGNIGSRIKDTALRQSAIDALVAVLSDDEAEVREEAAEALGNIASRIKDKTTLQPAIAPLTKLLKDEDNGVREFAGLALERISTSRLPHEGSTQE